MERKNTIKCLGGPRMEDQDVQNAQTFLVKNFFPLTAAKTQRSQRFQVSLSFEYADSTQLPGL